MSVLKTSDEIMREMGLDPDNRHDRIKWIHGIDPSDPNDQTKWIQPRFNYLDAKPRRKADMPDGQVLVHNFPPGYPDRKIGAGGFRIWTEPLRAELVVCPCNWSVRVRPHYNSSREDLEDIRAQRPEWFGEKENA